MIIKTISPETLKPHEYTLRCEQCENHTTSDELPYLEGWASAHVRCTGHTVVIEQRKENGP